MEISSESSVHLPPRLAGGRYTCEVREGFARLGLDFTSIGSTGMLEIAFIHPDGEASSFSSERGGIAVRDQLWRINEQRVNAMTMTPDIQLDLLKNLQYPLRLVFRRPGCGTATPSVCSTINSRRGSFRSSCSVASPSHGHGRLDTKMFGEVPILTLDEKFADHNSNCVDSASVKSANKQDAVDGASPELLLALSGTANGSSFCSSITSTCSSPRFSFDGSHMPPSNRGKSSSVMYWLNHESESDEDDPHIVVNNYKSPQRSPVDAPRQLTPGGSNRVGGSPVRVDPKMMTGVPPPWQLDTSPPRSNRHLLRRRKLSHELLDDLPEESLDSPDRRRRYNELLAMLPGGTRQDGEGPPTLNRTKSFMLLDSDVSIASSKSDVSSDYEKVSTLTPCTLTPSSCESSKKAKTQAFSSSKQRHTSPTPTCNNTSSACYPHAYELSTTCAPAHLRSPTLGTGRPKAGAVNIRGRPTLSLSPPPTNFNSRGVSPPANFNSRGVSPPPAKFNSSVVPPVSSPPPPASAKQCVSPLGTVRGLLRHFLPIGR